MTKHRAPSPYKGVPRSEWDRVKTEQAAMKEHAKMQPADAFAAVSSIELPPEVPVAPAPRINSDDAPTEIFRDMFSGTLKTLDVLGKNGSTTDPIPGYVLYWFTDEGGTGTVINQARMSGYDFVHRDEILLTENIVGNNDLGSHVRKVVNARTTPPEYGYLMKKPEDLHMKHLAEREKMHSRIDQALRAGTLGRQPGSGQYTKADDPSSSMAKIEISSNLYTENRNG